MAISGVNQNSYNSYVYQWQNQKLQNTGTTTNGGSSLGSYNYGGKSTVASMVELAQYAMDSMGVGKNERVTFSQVQQYKSQLEKEFSTNIQKGLEGLGVAKDAAFTVTVAQDGKILVDSSHPDKAKIQNYFDTHPEHGKQIRQDLANRNIKDSTPVKFSVSSTGIVSPISTQQNTLQDYFNQNSALGKDLHKALLELEVDVSKPFGLSMENGTLTVTGDHPDKAKIQEYLDTNPEVAGEVDKILEKLGLSQEGVSPKCELTVGGDGKITAKMEGQGDEYKAISEYLMSRNYGNTFKKGLESVGVDSTISFRLTVDDKGKIKVAGDHPDIAKVQKFFDDNPELAKQYQQIQALADLDAARKAMSISPNEMRKRIELEAMTAWWGNSGNATSSIGDFSGGNVSVMAGLNTRV